jgi:Tol biopolymer transport system component
MLTEDRLFALFRDFELSDSPRPGYLDELRESLAAMGVEPWAKRETGGIVDVRAGRWRWLVLSPRIARVALIVLLLGLLAAAAVGIALVGSGPSGGVENGRIAFVHAPTGVPQDIYVANPDGSGAVAVASTAAIEDTPKWSPDGSLIAFTRVLVPDGPKQGMPGTSGVFVVRPDGSAERLVAGPLPSPVFGMAWAPDGRQLSFLAGDPPGLLVVNADGSDVRYLFAGYYVDPVWSPDGVSLLLSGPAEYSNEDLYLVSLDGTARRLTATPGEESSPRWSPDGRWIVFSSRLDDSSPEAEIEVIDSGGERRRVVSDFGGSPDWSPDGEWIVFDGWLQRPGVWIVRPDGSGLRKVIDGESPRWSPDGSLIAFWADNDWWTIRPDGTDRQPTHIGSGNSLSDWWDWESVPRG